MTIQNDEECRSRRLTNISAKETFTHIATLNAINFRLCTTLLSPNRDRLHELLIRINLC